MTIQGVFFCFLREGAGDGLLSVASDISLPIAIIKFKSTSDKN
jgi:hypothetical protein